TLIGIGVVLCTLNWRLFLVVLIPAPFVAVLSKLFWKRGMTARQRWGDFRGRVHPPLNDSLSGIRVVEAGAQEEGEIARFNPRSFELAQAGQTAEQTWMTVFPILSWVTTSGALLVWYVGGRQLLAQQISLGTLVTFIAYLNMFYGPLQFLNRVS